jgi:hypothetical protein
MEASEGNDGKEPNDIFDIEGVDPKKSNLKLESAPLVGVAAACCWGIGRLAVDGGGAV